MITLSRGQRFDLSKLTGTGPLEITAKVRGTRSEPWTVCLLVLDGDDRAANDAFVGERRPNGAEGALRWASAGENLHGFQVDLDRLGSTARCALVAFAPPKDLTEHGSASVGEAEITLGRAGQAQATWPIKAGDFGPESAVVLAELYQKTTWRLGLTGGGFVGGGPVLLSHYRVPHDMARALLGGGPLPSRPAGPPSGDGSSSTKIRLPTVWPGGAQPRVPSGLLGSVGLLLVKTTADTSATGTGFFISPGGFLMTCAHVVEDAASVVYYDQTVRTLRPVEVVHVHPELDVAICWVADRLGNEQWLRLADPSVEPELGLDVGILGFPLGFTLGHEANVEPTYSQGIVNSVRKRAYGHALQVDAGAAPGSSGAPVFRRSDGHVVGVLSGGMEKHNAGIHMNFAVDLRGVHELGWF